MSKISSIQFWYLRAEAHFQFLDLFSQTISDFPVVNDVIGPFTGEFHDLLWKERDLVDASKASDYTQQIADADHRNDQLITGIKETIAAGLHHFDHNVAEAAQSLSLRMRAFGEVQAKSYEEELTAAELLIAAFRSPEYAAKVETVGLTVWVNQLDSSVQSFRQLLELRNAETAGKPQQRLRELRKQIEVVYHHMIERLNSAANLDETGKYNDFINLVNTRITYFNDHNHHPAPKSIRTADVEHITPRPYTGKAVTPIPRVYFNGEELFFAKDFTLTYKDNVKPGVAEVNITGKGNFGGKRIVTFNIVQDI